MSTRKLRQKDGAVYFATFSCHEWVPHNRAGALQTITLDGTDYVRHVAYNAKGQRTLLAMGNDMMTRYAYDPLTYRLLRIRTEKYEEDDHAYEPQSGTTKQDSGYEYDLGGNIVKIKERVTDCGINGSLLGVDALDRTFTYDPLKRLLTATGRESNTTGNTNFWGEKGAPGTPNANNARAYTQSYQYDGAGNIQQLGHAATGNSYTRHYWYPEFYRLGQVDNGGSPSTVHASFLYDANGNQVKVNTDRYFLWDAFDQLRHFRIHSGSTISVQAQYLYAGGDRVKKLVQDQFGNAQVTVYIDGVYEHRYTKDSVGDVQEEQTILHVMDGRSRIATIRLGDTLVDTGPAVKYNLEDHLGTSATRLTDTGTLIDKEEYYPFGDSSLRTFEAKRYRYVAKELDSESGLYYYGARYYAAWTCRFVSVDPLAPKYPQLTPYNYAANDPIGDLDIDGMQNTKTPEGGGSGENTIPADDVSQQPDALSVAVFIPELNLQYTNTYFFSSTCVAEQVHPVEQGETLTSIAKNHGVSIDQLRVANPRTQERKQRDQVNLCENLVIPEHDEFQLMRTITTTIGDTGIVRESRTEQVPPNPKGPYLVGLEWFTGLGPRENVFSNGDYFTNELQSHWSLEFSRRSIADSVRNSGGLEGNLDYSLAGIQGTKYLADAKAIVGASGNIAIAYLGSYNLHYEVFNIDAENRIAHIIFTVENSSTINSATHPLAVGYSPWYQEHIGDPLNSLFDKGMFSRTTQMFKWTETIKY